MSQTFDTKEILVCDFVKVISDIDIKSCDEIEKQIQDIIYKTRGLIHNSLSD